MANAGSPVDGERLKTLKALIDSASHLLGDLASEPLLGRTLRVFAGIPAEDRDAILSIIEREVQVRRNADAAEELTGLALRPNPSARLYTRVIAGESHPDRGRAVLSALRAMRAVDEAMIDGTWKAIAREALRALAPAERARMRRFAGEVMKLVDECASPAPAASRR